MENIEEPYARNNSENFLHFCKSLKVNKSSLVLINVSCLGYFYLKRKFTVFLGFKIFLETLILFSNLCFNQKNNNTIFFWEG